MMLGIAIMIVLSGSLGESCERILCRNEYIFNYVYRTFVQPKYVERMKILAAKWNGRNGYEC